MTLFSLIVPVWKQQEYLPDALDSILDQSVLDYEVIIIDDGSPDASGKIADSFAAKDARFKVVHQVNKGLASARNTGIMNATGSYVVPLDADDILLPECLAAFALAIEKTQADIIAPSFKNFGLINMPVILDAVPSLVDFKIANRLPYFSAIRRSALLECGGYSSRMDQGYEDFHLWFDLLSRGKSICCLTDILVLYRTKDSSMLTEANKHRDHLMSQIAKDFPQVFI